jgi:hypothetical protein
MDKRKVETSQEDYRALTSTVPQERYCRGCILNIACNVILKDGESCGDRAEGIEKMATLTERAEEKIIEALTDSYFLLKGSDMGNRMMGKTVVRKISDALQFFYSEKMREENHYEWGGHSLDIPNPPVFKDTDSTPPADCNSLSNPGDFEY